MPPPGNPQVTAEDVNTNEGSPLMASSTATTTATSAIKTRSKAAYTVLHHNFNLLLSVIVMVFLLAAAGQRASIRDFLTNSSLDSDHNDKDVPNGKINGTLDSSSDEESSFQMIEACQVMYHSASSSSSSMNVRIIQTAKESPSEHYVPLSCKVVKKLTSNADIAVGEMAPITVDFLDILNADRENGIVGFGGAFTEASALNFHSLNEDGQEAVLDLLFGESGLGYNMGRVHMNSCDFCTESYSFDDVDGDFDLDHFDNEITHDVNTGMIDMMQRAQAKLKESWTSSNEHPLHLIASPWSPPAWMKSPTTNEHNDYQHILDHAKTMDGSSWPTCLREGTGLGSRFARSWALYFSKFINACKFILHLANICIFRYQLEC